MLAAAVLAACGNDLAKPDPGLLIPSASSKQFAAKDAGLTVQLPANLERQVLKAPGLFFAVLGRTVVSVYAYKRGEQLPRNKGELAAARRRLVSSTKKRDKSYKLISANATRVGGARAVELVGRQKLAGERVQIRSIHVYKGNVEYVIEIFAPVGDFKARDAAITPGVLKSLKVTGKLAADEKKKAAARKKAAEAKAKSKTKTTPTTTTPANTTTTP